MRWAASTAAPWSSGPGRRDQGRPLPLAVAGDLLHPHRWPQGRLPSNPHDAKGLLLSSIKDPDPVMFFERSVYRAANDVLDEAYEIPLGARRSFERVAT